MSDAGVVIDDLVVEYVHEGYRVRAVDGISLHAEPGEIVALLGPSGCGKTTTLSCLAGILTPTSGTIAIAGQPLEGDLVEHRRSRVGIVFQAFNLIASMTARENVAVPLLAAGMKVRAALARADELLALVGLTDRAGHLPEKLSGGQQQRVAIARALAHDPPVLLADEPTANLDYVQADAIIGLLRDLRTQGRTVIISTHDDRLIPIADRVVRMVPEHVEGASVGGLVSFAAGETIFGQGERGELAYVIQQGEVDIVRQLEQGERLLATLMPGRYFGELAPLIGFPRSASARARTDVVLRAYGVQEFREQVLDRDGITKGAPAPPTKPKARAARKKRAPKKAAAKKPTRKKPAARKKTTARRSTRS